jgi:hypothetical protein
MSDLKFSENCLGFEISDGPRLMALYRAREELPRSESPKPCFAPIYTPDGKLITEYRPADHAWHTGLYFGWVHANDINLWGGPWYLPEKGRYETVDNSHGVQRHVGQFEKTSQGAGIGVGEELEWLDADDRCMASEKRTFSFDKMGGANGYNWVVKTAIRPEGAKLVLGASRAARYSGFELRMGSSFADAHHRSSEGLEGHENIMGQPARWVSAAGASGGAVVMMDHPSNPRHPVTWFTRKNLLGAGLLMEGDLEVEVGECLDLRYGFSIFEDAATVETIEALYQDFAR